jgi:hypothetical protein
LRDMPANAGNHHSQRITLFALPVVENQHRLPEIPTAANRAVRRLSTKR